MVMTEKQLEEILKETRSNIFRVKAKLNLAQGLNEEK